jgi:AcrR family transcriptional regulator
MVLALVPRTNLTPQDWAKAALDAIAEGGVSAVAVEALAPRVGASKGSFYWHFDDRAAVLEEALALWEANLTDAVIEELQRVADPRERLRRLFLLAFRGRTAGRLATALTTHPATERMADVLRRVTDRRIVFLTEAFIELGFAASDARTRALITYNAYLGFFALAQGHPAAVPPHGRSRDRYIETLLEVLTKT